MSDPQLYCRSITTFNPEGQFDEDAFRSFLQRLIDARVGVYLASAGSGESGALTARELRQVYRIGVETCRGKVPVHGNPPEKLSVAETLEHIRLAIEGGVEIVNLYGPAGWHGYKPTDEEYIGFMEEILAEVKHPVAISPNPAIGRTATPAMLADLCHRYSQIVAINLADQNDDYFIGLKDNLKRDVAINVPLTSSMEMFLLGADGLIGAEPNMAPKTYRAYVDLCAAGNFVEAAIVYAQLRRFVEFVKRWKSAHPRWMKMMMKTLGIPGWGIRGPYRMAPDAVQHEFIDGLLRLRMPEIDDMARAAGIPLPD
jgi:4-hydroxy-tetrahydrodipicolinate synthase